MGNHSYWCDVSKNAPCDCGFEEIKLARSILLEIQKEDYYYYDDYKDEYICFYCYESQDAVLGQTPTISHKIDCVYLKLHNFLGRYAPKN